MHSLESLERRTLLSAVTVTFVKGVLTINGTAGNDSFYLSYGSGAKLYVVGSSGSIASQPVADIKRIVFLGGDGDDSLQINPTLGAIPASLVGGNGDDRLYGGSGNDTIIGGPGRDWLAGNDGNDYIEGNDADDNLGGGKGNDTIFAGAGRDLMVGGEGDDWLDGGADADVFRGGSGIDTASYADRTNPVFVDINGMPGEPHDDGEIGERDFVEIDMENIIGGSGNDVLIGTLAPADADKTTVGFTQNNLLVGNGGNDTLYGLAGNDTLDGGLGADVFAGGAGTDTADYSSRTEKLTLNLDGKANDGAANERDLIRTDIENLTGGSNHDRITGNARNNVLRGNAGNDTLDGGLGKDVLAGGAGTDTAYYASRREKLVLNLDGLANDGAAGENDKIEADVENLTGGHGNDAVPQERPPNVGKSIPIFPKIGMSPFLLPLCRLPFVGGFDQNNSEKRGHS